jgi:hypothetical protein
MHDTARCLGYPLDSTRATCGYHLRWTGQAQPGWATPSLVIAASPSPPRLNSSPVWLEPSPPAPLWLNSVWLALLSHLAGVGQCPLAIGLGCLVGLLAGVLNRRPVSPLPSTSARSGAGSGWQSRRQIADSAVYPEGLAPGGAGLPSLSCAISWAVSAPPPPRHRDRARHRDRVADRQRRAAAQVSGLPD